MGQLQRIHPLDRLISDDSLFLIEAMIPFVDNNAKRILVIILKFMELNAIMNSLNNPSILSSCGFDCKPQSTNDIIYHICEFLPDDMKASFNQMKQMSQMMQLFNISDASTKGNTYSKDSLFDSVMSILNEDGG